MVPGMENLDEDITFLYLPILFVIHSIVLTLYSLICLLVVTLLQEASTEPFSLRSNTPLDLLTEITLSQLKSANFSFSCQVIKGAPSDWGAVYLLEYTLFGPFVVFILLSYMGDTFRRETGLTFTTDLVETLDSMSHSSEAQLVDFNLIIMESMVKVESLHLLFLASILYWMPFESHETHFNTHNEHYLRYFSEFCQLVNADSTINGERIYIYEKWFDGVRSYFIHILGYQCLRNLVLVMGIISFINLIKYINCYYETMCYKLWGKFPGMLPDFDESLSGDVYFDAEEC